MLRQDYLWNFVDYLLQLGSKVLVDLGVSAIRLDLGESGLLRSLDDELVDVGAVHDLGGNVGCRLDCGVVVEAENLRHVF